jgi:hypothetical protein
MRSRIFNDPLFTHNDKGCISTDRAIDISSVLSVESRRAVLFLCASASVKNTENSPSSRLRQDLLMRVFSRSLWIDDSSTTESGNIDGKKSDHPTWTWLKSHLNEVSSDSSANVTSSAPVGSWLSLVSMYCGSLDTVTSMAMFWQECIEEVSIKSIVSLTYYSVPATAYH